MPGELSEARGAAGGPASSAGIIPEFVGRLPVVAPLHELNDGRARRHPDANRRTRSCEQYQQALRDGRGETQVHQRRAARDRQRGAAAQQLARVASARSSRTSMLDIMYDIPSQENIKEVLINEDVIHKGGSPIVVYAKDAAGAER
jgi:ATP-dependent Clp protease ATP-binding subunit ClpX